MIDRDDSGRGIGQELLDLSDVLFVYWGEVRAGRLTRWKIVTKSACRKFSFGKHLRVGDEGLEPPASCV